MDRRKFLSAVATLGAASGVTLTPQIIEAEPEPLLIVVKVGGNLSYVDAVRIKKSMEDAFGDFPHPPIVVVHEGLDILAVTAPV